MAELFPGYTVEKLDEPEGGELGFSYTVTGPRGKTWKLVRNKPNPSLLFPVPENFMTDSMKIRGYTWFSDKSGELRPLR